MSTGPDGGRLRVAVDFGTSSTVAVLGRGSSPAQVVLVDGAPVFPSGVHVDADGVVRVGFDAERRAAVDPSRYEPHPKRRIDEGELLLGVSVVPVDVVVRAVLSRAVDEARRIAGGAEVEQLVLTHPADWGAVRTVVLRRSAVGLAREVLLVPEPVAAALFHVLEPASSDVGAGPPGAPLAVLDLGGGTVDASVVAVGANGIGPRVLATAGDPTVGGVDVDEALLRHIGSLVSSRDPAAWHALTAGTDLADRRRGRVLRADVRGAKETLSRHTYADVPLPDPFTDAHVTRADLERLMAEPLGRAVDLLLRTVVAARVGPGPLRGVFLVGGSSRIPMVSRLVHERLGVLPVSLDQPETVVARGALALTRPRLRGEPTPSTTGRTYRHAVGGAPTPARGVPAASAPPDETTASRARNRRWRERAALATGALLAVVGVVVAVSVWSADTEGTGGVALDTVTRHGYQFAMPDGWREVGDDPALRQVRFSPPGTAGPAALFVQRNGLDYDADADRTRAVDELQDQIAAADPGRYSDFVADADVEGRRVTRYREITGDGSAVDWYVLFDGRSQVSVGCRAGAATGVARACAQVVGSLTVE